MTFQYAMVKVVIFPTKKLTRNLKMKRQQFSRQFAPKTTQILSLNKYVCSKALGSTLLITKLIKTDVFCRGYFVLSRFIRKLVNFLFQNSVMLYFEHKQKYQQSNKKPADIFNVIPRLFSFIFECMYGALLPIFSCQQNICPY